MERLTGRIGLSVGVYVTTLMLLAPRAAAAGDAAAAPGAPDSTVAAGAVALAAAAAQDEPAEPEAPAQESGGGMAEFFSQIAVSGLVDGYYQFAFNEEPPALRSFDLTHNSFTLSQAKIALEKPVSDTSRAGFRVDFHIGDTADIVNSFEPGSDDLKFVEQAYVSYLVPAGSGLKFDFGKFVTPIGAEVIEAAPNYNYSRGILFGYAIPFYHMGARVGYTVNDRFSITGFLVNGWNNVLDNNGGKTAAVSLAFTPGDGMSLVQNYMVGAEGDDNSDDLRHMLDTVFSYTFSDETSFLANFDYGHDSVEGTSDWYGVAASLRHQLNETWAVAPRYEIFKDDDGWATGQAQTVQSITLTAEHKISDFITRIEWRSDFSDEPFFADGDALKESQSALIVAFIYTFASN